MIYLLFLLSLIEKCGNNVMYKLLSVIYSVHKSFLQKGVKIRCMWGNPYTFLFDIKYIGDSINHLKWGHRHKGFIEHNVQTTIIIKNIYYDV